jgi:hypothetical protein
MSNWAAYKEKEIGLPVVKRAKHGIHFKRSDGQIQAEFVGKPCHYFDGKEYKAIDTRPLLRKDGTFGCAHSDVIIHTDGTVQVGDYTQRAALIYPGKISVDGDRIARPFSGGVQYLYITEDGFRQEIVLEKMLDLRKVSALVDSVKGILPTKYTASSLSLKDSSTAELSDFVQVDKVSLASVLEAAKYPVVIDPDFASESSSWAIYGSNADYATARATSFSGMAPNTTIIIGQRSTYQVQRGALKFVTSTIGAGSTITQVNISMVCATDQSTKDFDVQIVKFDWSSYDPYATANREDNYDGCLAADADDNIWRNTSGMSVETAYTSGNLATTWVSKTGNTYYGLRSKDDYDATTPTNLTERITLGGPTNATESYRPVLTVTYTAAGTFIPVNFNAQMQAPTGGMRG